MSLSPIHRVNSQVNQNGCVHGIPNSRKRKLHEILESQGGVSKKMKTEKQKSLAEKHHTLSIQSNPKTPYLEYFRQGIKKAEGRINYPTFSKYQVGDLIYFHNRRDGILCKITFLNRYQSFSEMLNSEGILNMLPQLKDQPVSDLFEKSLLIYKKFPNAEKAEEHGVIAIGVEFLKNKIPGKKNKN